MILRKHFHYFRSVAHLNEIDIYRFLDLFNVTDQALGHAIKKLVVPGMRGGGKTSRKDIEEAIDTLQRKLEMMDEDAAIEKAEPEHPWLDWDPGRIHPVGDVLVDVRFRNGVIRSGLRSDRVIWSHASEGTDVVAYRINHGG